jgi:hypothetical protein
LGRRQAVSLSDWGLTRVPPDFSGWPLPWRYAAAGLALPEKVHTSMIQFLKNVHHPRP